MPERETTVLQHVDLEADPATQKLYFRYWDPAGKRAALSDEDRSLHIEAGLTVSFDAYFNSFYARYWDECTSVSTVKLRLRLTGRGAVSVFRQSRDGAIDEAGRLPFDSSAATTIEVPLPDFAGGADPSGRFWFDVHASTDCTVYGGEWVTSEPPVREVSPSVVFCTYNRVGYLSRIIRVLADRKDVYAEISRIYIVNQGDRFELSDLVTGVSEDFLSRVEVIEQTNLGGCGGFSRGMYETLKDASLTHFILLDDDVRLHPESLFRAIRFMAYANDDVVLGGHMLDLVRPQWLYEAGANFHPESALPKPIGNHEPLDEPESLAMFLRVRPADYNGWWFFMAPMAVVGKLGLPVPCFIRGDDMEYGARLARNGVKTIPMPGVAVWHEPFYLKLGNWQYYFEVRNRLMMLSLHRNGELKAVRRQIRHTFHRDAMLSRYNMCQYAIDAVRDYLEGGERVFDTSNRAFLQCIEHQKTIGPKRIEGQATPSLRRFGRLRRYATLWSMPFVRAARLALPVSSRPPKVLRMRYDQLVPWRPLVFDRYRVVEEHDRSVWQFERNPALERRQFIEFERLMRKLEYRFTDAAVDTSAGTPWLGWWTRQFDGSR